MATTIPEKVYPGRFSMFSTKSQAQVITSLIRSQTNSFAPDFGASNQIQVKYFFQRSNREFSLSHCFDQNTYAKQRENSSRFNYPLVIYKKHIDLFGIVATILDCMQKYGGQICRGEIPLENMQNICNFTQRILSPQSIF